MTNIFLSACSSSSQSSPISVGRGLWIELRCFNVYQRGCEKHLFDSVFDLRFSAALLNGVSRVKGKKVNSLAQENVSTVIHISPESMAHQCHLSLPMYDVDWPE